MITFRYFALPVIFSALIWIGSALAHSGVENELVKKRMMSMKELASSMKHLGKVRRGAIPFDIEEIRKTLASIKYNAVITPELFEVYAMDPLSEAGTEIWETFDDFKIKAGVLESVANSLLNTLDSQEEVNDALMDLGASCKACHSKYRN